MFSKSIICILVLIFESTHQQRDGVTEREQTLQRVTEMKRGMQLQQNVSSRQISKGRSAKGWFNFYVQPASWYNAGLFVTSDLCHQGGFIFMFRPANQAERHLHVRVRANVRVHYFDLASGYIWC